MKDFLVDVMNAMFAGAFFCVALLIGHAIWTGASAAALFCMAIFLVTLVGALCLR